MAIKGDSMRRHYAIMSGITLFLSYALNFRIGNLLFLYFFCFLDLLTSLLMLDNNNYKCFSNGLISKIFLKLAHWNWSFKMRKIIIFLLSFILFYSALIAGEAIVVNWQQDCRYVYRLKIVEQTQKANLVFPGTISTGWVYCDVELSENPIGDQLLLWGYFLFLHDSLYNGKHREIDGYFLQELQKNNITLQSISMKKKIRANVQEGSPLLPFLLGLGILLLPDEPLECGTQKKISQKIRENLGCFAGDAQGAWCIVDENAIRRGVESCFQLRLKATTIEYAIDETVPLANASIEGDLWVTKSGTLLEWSSVITRTSGADNKKQTQETIVSLTLEEKTNKYVDLYSRPWFNKRVFLPVGSI